MKEFTVKHLVMAYSRSHCRDLDKHLRLEYAQLYDVLSGVLRFDLESDVTTSFGKSALDILQHQAHEKKLGAKIDLVNRFTEDALASHL